MNECGFNMAWRGRCKEQNCKEHANLACCSCGNPATHSCPEASSLVCGMPLCGDCCHGKAGHIPKERSNE